MPPALEPILVEALLTMARAAAKDRGCKLSTVGRLVHGDSPFFINIAARKISFTARKFDEIMAWFLSDANWRDVANRPALPVWWDAMPKPRRR